MKKAQYIYSCDYCGKPKQCEHMPYVWYALKSEMTGDDFHICRDCAEVVHRHLTDLIQDFPHDNH